MRNKKFTIDPQDLYDFRVKRYARAMVHQAILDGELEKSEHCEECGMYCEQIQAHHTDYGQPLAVTWVCPTCHYKIHGSTSHPLNPLNFEQTILHGHKTRLTYARIGFKIPVENYLIAQRIAEKRGTSIEDEICRTLVRAYPINAVVRDDDNTRKQYYQGISSMVENEAELLQQELPRLSDARSERDNSLSAVDRFYSVCARNG